MFAESREILIPHDPTRGALKAVRRMLVQSSLAELKERGHYERYCSGIDGAVLESINDQVGPGWLPIELAMAHYRACDALGLSNAELDESGAISGEKLARSLLVTGVHNGPDGEVAPWLAIGAFSRMGRRIYEGGSAQYVKLGPKQLQIENMGNPLLSIHYYRIAHLGFLRRAFDSLGVHVTEARITPFRAEGGKVEVQLSWA
jgi:hypothetical protein